MWEQQKACQDGAEIIVATPVSKTEIMIVFTYSVCLDTSVFIHC